MSATEVTEQIKTLPSQERWQVLDFLKEWAGRQPERPSVQYLGQTAFRTAKKRVFSRHVPLLQKLAK